MISIPAGVLQMKIPKFLFYTFLGSCVWSTGIILAGYYFGVTVFENINTVSLKLEHFLFSSKVGHTN